MQQKERTSKEVVQAWRDWNKARKDSGKAPEPFFTRWLDAHFVRCASELTEVEIDRCIKDAEAVLHRHDTPFKPCYTCEESCKEECVRRTYE